MTRERYAPAPDGLGLIDTWPWWKQEMERWGLACTLLLIGFILFGLFDADGNDTVIRWQPALFWLCVCRLGVTVLNFVEH